MYCNHCGNKIENDSKFCSSCGKKINAIEFEKHKKTEETNIVMSIFNHLRQLNSNQWLVILMCFLIVAFIIVFCLKSCNEFSGWKKAEEKDGITNDVNHNESDWDENYSDFYEEPTDSEMIEVEEPLVNLENANTLGNSPELIRQGGKFAYQDGWLYYSLDSTGIYKLPDGGGEGDVVKISEGNGYSLNVVGEWLYFRCGEWEKQEIKRIKINGMEEQVLYSGYISSDVFVGDNKIFFGRKIDEGTYTTSYISTMNLDGSDMQDIAEGYYLETVNFEADAVLGKNKDTNEFTGFNYEGGDTNAYDAVINLGNRYPESSIISDINGTAQSVIYAYNGGYFFLSHPTETDIESFITIGQGSMPDFCYYNGYFYTLIRDSRLGDVEDDGIYRCDGTETWIRASEDVFNIYILGDGWIYYCENRDDWYRCRLDGTEKEKINWMYQ